MAAAAIRTLSLQMQQMTWRRSNNSEWYKINSKSLPREHKFWTLVAAETSNASSDSAASACSWVNLTLWGSLINFVLWATTTSKYIVNDYDNLWFKSELKWTTTTLPVAKRTATNKTVFTDTEDNSSMLRTSTYIHLRISSPKKRPARYYF